MLTDRQTDRQIDTQTDPIALPPLAGRDLNTAILTSAAILSDLYLRCVLGATVHAFPVAVHPIFATEAVQIVKYWSREKWRQFLHGSNRTRGDGLAGIMHMSMKYVYRRWSERLDYPCILHRETTRVRYGIRYSD